MVEGSHICCVYIIILIVYNKATKNKAKVFGLISSLSWNFKAIHTRSAALAWLKKKNQKKKGEQSPVLNTFRFAIIDCYTF